MAPKIQEEGDPLLGKATTLGQYPSNVQQSRLDNFNRNPSAKPQSGGGYGRDKEKMDSYDSASETELGIIRERLHTPLKYEPASSEEDGSSSPRDVISSARRWASVRGPKFDKFDRRSNALQLPKLTGRARERFNLQRLRVKQWQAEHDITPVDREAKRDNRRTIQKLKRDRRKQRKLERRSAATSMLNIEDGSLLAMSDSDSCSNDPDEPKLDVMAT